MRDKKNSYSLMPLSLLKWNKANGGESKPQKYIYIERERERGREGEGENQLGCELNIACEHARTWGTDVSKPSPRGNSLTMKAPLAIWSMVVNTLL